jgi:hypothetical protein
MSVKLRILYDVLIYMNFFDDSISDLSSVSSCDTESTQPAVEFEINNVPEKSNITINLNIDESRWLDGIEEGCR